MSTPTAVSDTWTRPAWVDTMSQAYLRRRKNLVIVTGNVVDLCWSPKQKVFMGLEQMLFQETVERFTAIRINISSGIQVYDPLALEEIQRVCNLADVTAKPGEKIGDIEKLFAETRFNPLVTLTVIRRLTEAFTRAARVREAKVKPLLIVIAYAGALLVPGDFERLSEIDRQRLVAFIEWVGSPEMFDPKYSSHLVVLLSETQAEINKRVLSLPGSESIEIPLPSTNDRLQFVQHFTGQNPIKFEQSETRFVGDATGLKLTQLQELLSEASMGTEPVTSKGVLALVNKALKALLGDVIEVRARTHGRDDIVGCAPFKEFMTQLFADCEDPRTAVPGFIVAGANGGGKTFGVEGVSFDSGWTVIRLTGIRSQWVGVMDQNLEKLAMVLLIFNKTLIGIDEAHTQFSSTHRSDVHETERRQSGTIYTFMSDKRFLGKVIWALMSSRPDLLDPDLRSRLDDQLPIFDPEGEEWQTFVVEMFRRGGIDLPESDIPEVVKLTRPFAPRKLDRIIRKVRARKKPVLEILRKQRVDARLVLERRCQALLAAQSCSEDELLPPSIAAMTSEQIATEIATLKGQFGWE